MTMGEEMRAPKMLSSVSIIHIRVGPFVMVEQTLPIYFYYPNYKNLSLCYLYMLARL